MPTSPCYGTTSHCSILHHIAEFCTKARNSFLSPSSSHVQNSAKLCKTASSAPLQHHSGPPRCCPGFQAFPPVSSCLWTTCNTLQPVEINPRVSDPQTTPGLFECPPHHAMELPIIAAYCIILQHSAPKQEQISWSGLDWH